MNPVDEVHIYDILGKGRERRSATVVIFIFFLLENVIYKM
jgi:hypothetical protein